MNNLISSYELHKIFCEVSQGISANCANSLGDTLVVSPKGVTNFGCEFHWKEKFKSKSMSEDTPSQTLNQDEPYGVSFIGKGSRDRLIKLGSKWKSPLEMFSVDRLKPILKLN